MFGQTLRVAAFSCTVSFVNLIMANGQIWAAPTPAYITTSVSSSFSNSGTLGFEFTPQADIVVKALGFYDHGADGLPNTWPVGWPLVGIWKMDGTPIVSSAVTSSDPLDGMHRFTTIADTLLDGGTTYIIGGWSEGQPVTWTGGSTISVAADIALGLARWHPSSNLNFPPNSTAGFVYNQPNFKYVLAVPEPGSLLLLIIGLGIIGGRRLR